MEAPSSARSNNRARELLILTAWTHLRDLRALSRVWTMRQNQPRATPGMGLLHIAGEVVSQATPSAHGPMAQRFAQGEPYVPVIEVTKLQEERETAAGTPFDALRICGVP